MHYVRERDRSIRTRGRHVLPTLDRHPCAHQTHTNVASPTNDPPAYPRFRYRLLLSFPQAVLIRHPGGLGVVWEIDRDALPASRFGDCVYVAGDVLFVVAKRAKRWRLPACFTASDQKQYAPVQAVRPQTARGGQCASFVTGAGRGIGYTFVFCFGHGRWRSRRNGAAGVACASPIFPCSAAEQTVAVRAASLTGHSRAPAPFQRACLDTHFQTRYDNHRCHPTTDSPPASHTVALQREQASRNSALQHFPGAGRAFGR